MDEITDLLKCIAKFDKSETLKNKGRYFETVQKDAERLVKLLDLHNVVKSLSDLDGLTIPVTFSVKKHQPRIIIEDV